MIVVSALSHCFSFSLKEKSTKARIVFTAALLHLNMWPLYLTFMSAHITRDADSSDKCSHHKTENVHLFFILFYSHACTVDCVFNSIKYLCPIEVMLFRQYYAAVYFSECQCWFHLLLAFCFALLWSALHYCKNKNAVSFMIINQ